MIKVKVPQLGEFIVCGYTAGTGWRSSTFGALVLAKETLNGLVYVGCVGTGTGFNVSGLNLIYNKMIQIKDVCPFDRPPEKATWIKPVISVLIEYLEVTKDGSLRFPSYKWMTN